LFRYRIGDGFEVLGGHRLSNAIPNKTFDWKRAIYSRRARRGKEAPLSKLHRLLSLPSLTVSFSSPHSIYCIVLLKNLLIYIHFFNHM